ncbi:MAG: MFS transporter [bacterium]
MSSQYIGFIIIFSVAMLSRMISFIYLTKKYEPTFQLIEEKENGFMHFLKKVRSENYGLFVLYLSFMNFSVYLASPFFTPYMLYTLGLDYKIYTLVHAASLIIKFITMPIWGELLDKYGTKKILVVSGVLMPLVPLLWIFSQKIWYLILIQCYGGFIWAGFEISSFTFIFDTTAPHQRAAYVAYFNVINGIAVFFGGIIDGAIIRYNPLFSSHYFSVFILSSLLRYAASFFFLLQLKEVRVVEEISYRKLLFKFITTMPTRGLVYNVITLKKNNKSQDT